MSGLIVRLHCSEWVSKRVHCQIRYICNDTASVQLLLFTLVVGCR